MSRQMSGAQRREPEFLPTPGPELYIVEEPLDICKVNERVLSTGEPVNMSIGAFAFLGYINREAGGAGVWMQQQGTCRGIAKNFTQEIESTHPIAKSLISFCIDQAFVEISQNKKTVVNARLLDKGRLSFQELQAEYGPLVARVVDPPRRKTISVMLDEIERAYVFTGNVLPDRLSKLMATYDQVESDKLPVIIEKLTNEQNEIFRLADNKTRKG